MGHKHSRDGVLDAAVAVAGRVGLGGLSYRLVAQEAGTSDRMVVYYFADKTALLGGVLARVGDELRAILEQSLPAAGPDGLTRAQVLRASRSVFTDPDRQPVLRLLVEAVGLGAAGREPFATVVPQLLQGWVVWLEGRMGPAGPGEAVATVATVEGLVIVGGLLGPDARAAAWDALTRDGTTRAGTG
ncbi:TetR/AcrR family transcriptional regulator [Jannaschia sp. R86511]|uniref:TetR/AcrR family transcriptional regulator n=1 Tax=Jannaschia sp. R86511 TaxID=3093853 RepID=UPI0036D2A33C